MYCCHLSNIILLIHINKSSSIIARQAQKLFIFFFLIQLQYSICIRNFRGTTTDQLLYRKHFLNLIYRPLKQIITAHRLTLQELFIKGAQISCFINQQVWPRNLAPIQHICLSNLMIADLIPSIAN